MLADHFGGDVISLYPFSQPHSWYPRPLYGLDKLGAIKRAARKADFVHFFAPDLYNYPIFRFINSPVIYQVTSGLSKLTLSSDLKSFTQFRQILLSSDRDYKRLHSLGFNNIATILPGLDLSRFGPSFLPVGDQFIILMASAPWEIKQFQSKGVELLIQLASARPDFKIIFLWRGLHFGHLKKMLSKWGHPFNVEVINEKVDIAQLHQRIHATILLSKEAGIVKAYPHSLIESLASGKPVICSRMIAMADHVEERGVGFVLDELTVDSLELAINSIRNRYESSLENTSKTAKTDFGLERFLREVEGVYAKVNR